MTPSIKIRVALFGRNIDPDYVTRELGILPSATWRFGDRVSGTNIMLEHDGWEIETVETSTVDLPCEMRKLLGRIEPIENKIVELSRTLDLELEVSCSVFFVDQLPVLHFDAADLAPIVRLGASLDIDIIQTE